MTLFGSLRSMDARSLAGPALDVRVPAGTELIEAGTLIGTFFVIRAGTAELRQGDRPIRELATGDGFGESDPLAPHPQPYAVVATSPMRLLAFSSFGISRLCDAIPAVQEHIRESTAAAV